MKKLKIIFLILLAFALVEPAHGQSIDWIPLSKAQEMASQNGKKVMIFAEAEWCQYCKKMYAEVFPQKTVQDSLSKYFYPVRIDIESKNKVTFNGKEFTERELAGRFRVSRTPTTIFLDSEGKVIGNQPGYLPTRIFDKMLAFVGAGLQEEISFKDYLKKHGVDIDR